MLYSFAHLHNCFKNIAHIPPISHIFKEQNIKNNSFPRLDWITLEELHPILAEYPKNHVLS